MSDSPYYSNTTLHPKKAPIHAFMQTLGVPYGVERSCKFEKSTINAKRYLVTQHVDVLKLPRNKPHALTEFVKTLGLNEAGLNWFTSTLPKAELFHLGYEPQDTQSRYKLYFEFPVHGFLGTNPDQAAFLDQAALLNQSPLVHQAIKWCASGGQPNVQASQVVTDYWLINDEDVQQQITRIKAYFKPLNSLAVPRELSALASWFETWLSDVVYPLSGNQQSANSPLMLLDVSEQGNARHSFDINLYNLGLTLSAVKSLAPVLCDIYALDAQQVDAFFVEHADKSLGHIASGLSRSGESFLTLYFAPEEMSCE